VLPDISIEKANNVDKFSKETKDNISKRTKSEALSTEGIANDIKVEPVPYYLKSPCESLLTNGKNNQWIVVGRDRPDDLLSGYGGRGDTKCGSIDIVVGRKLPSKGIVDDNGDKIYVNPNFSDDAARIHISQRTNIDKNFKLRDGSIGNSVAKSGIGIKADSVRIIGREGIKLVTRGDKKNSIGGEINQVQGIDLIAGNNDRDLQPMVKGKNLKEFLSKIQQDISALTGMINSLATKQVALDAALSIHAHPLLPTVDPVTGLPSVAPSPTLAVACASDSIQIACLDNPSHFGQQVNTAATNLDYLNPISPVYILSKFNNTN
jgi:hypothetical protein